MEEKNIIFENDSEKKANIIETSKEVVDIFEDNKKTEEVNEKDKEAIKIIPEKEEIFVPKEQMDGTNDHNKLTNRNLPNQHNIDSITNLKEELEKKANNIDVPKNTSDLTNDSEFTTNKEVDDKIKNIPQYTLPQATEDILGGVKAKAKTEDMTQEVGIDDTGKLWALPGGGGGPSGGNGIPDWNQSDPNGEGYIKNRPMYIDKGNSVDWNGDASTTLGSFEFIPPPESGMPPMSFYKLAEYKNVDLDGKNCVDSSGYSFNISTNDRYYPLMTTPNGSQLVFPYILNIKEAGEYPIIGQVPDAGLYSVFVDIGGGATMYVTHLGLSPVVKKFLSPELRPTGFLNLINSPLYDWNKIEWDGYSYIGDTIHLPNYDGMIERVAFKIAELPPNELAFEMSSYYGATITELGADPVVISKATSQFNGGFEYGGKVFFVQFGGAEYQGIKFPDSGIYYTSYKLGERDYTRHVEWCSPPYTRLDPIYEFQRFRQLPVKYLPFGKENTIKGESSFAIGSFNNIEGRDNVAIGSVCKTYGRAYETVLIGQNLKSKYYNQIVLGRFNNETAENSDSLALMYGSGTYNGNRSNIGTFDYQGNAWIAGTMTSNGADYAEYFEWIDGNQDGEDRVGYVVALEGDKIRLANNIDEMLGVISGTAMVLGDNADSEWTNRWKKDDFGRVIWHMEDKLDKNGKVIGKFPVREINPEWNKDEKYIPRKNRPEWDAVGLIGKLYTRDDGSCIVGKFAKVKNGILTNSEDKTNIRVMKRITDKIVLVMIK